MNKDTIEVMQYQKDHIASCTDTLGRKLSKQNIEIDAIDTIRLLDKKLEAIKDLLLEAVNQLENHE